MNSSGKSINIIAGILVACSVILGLLKVASIVNWDWLWVTSGLWLGLIIFVSVIIYHSVHKESPKPDKPEPRKKSTEEIIGKALDDIREKNKKLKLYEAGDPVEKAVKMLKQERNDRIEREADKLNRLRGKNS